MDTYLNVAIDGKSVDTDNSLLDFSVDMSDGGYCLSVSLSLSSKEIWDRCDPMDMYGTLRIAVYINDDVLWFMLEERDTTETNGGTVYSLWGRSKQAWLDAPFSEVFTNTCDSEYIWQEGTVMASQIAEAVSGDIDLYWNAIDFPVYSFSFSPSKQSSISIISQLVEIAGAMLVPGADGSLSVETYAVESDTTVESFDEADDIISISESINASDGYNAVIVYGYGTSSDATPRITIEEDPDRDGYGSNRFLRVYYYHPDHRYPPMVYYTDGVYTRSSVVHESITEDVEFTFGVGNTSKMDVNGETQITLETEVPFFVLPITYQTRFLKYSLSARSFDHQYAFFYFEDLSSHALYSFDPTSSGSDEDIWDYCGSIKVEKHSPENVTPGDVATIRYYGKYAPDNGFSSTLQTVDKSGSPSACSVVEDVVFTNGDASTTYPIHSLTSVTFTADGISDQPSCSDGSTRMRVGRFIGNELYYFMSATVVYETEYQPYSLYVPDLWGFDQIHFLFQPTDETCGVKTGSISITGDNTSDTNSDRCSAVQLTCDSEKRLGETIYIRWYGAFAPESGKSFSGENIRIYQSSVAQTISESVSFTNGATTVTYPITSITSITIGDKAIAAADILFSSETNAVMIDNLVGSFDDYFKIGDIVYQTSYDVYRATIPTNWKHQSFGAWFQPDDDNCDIKSISFTLSGVDDDDSSLCASASIEKVDPPGNVYAGDNVLLRYYGYGAPDTATAYNGDTMQATSNEIIVQMQDVVAFVNGAISLSYPIDSIVSIIDVDSGASVSEYLFTRYASNVTLPAIQGDDDQYIKICTVTYTTMYRTYAQIVPEEWAASEYGAWFQPTNDACDIKSIGFSISVAGEDDAFDWDYCGSVAIEKYSPENVLPGDSAQIRYYGKYAPTYGYASSRQTILKSGMPSVSAHVEDVVFTNGHASVSYPITLLDTVVFEDDSRQTVVDFMDGSNKLYAAAFVDDIDNHFVMATVTYQATFQPYRVYVPVTWAFSQFYYLFQPTDEACGVKSGSFSISGSAVSDTSKCSSISLTCDSKKLLGSMVDIRWYGAFAPESGKSFSGETLVKDQRDVAQTVAELVMLTNGSGSVSLPVKTIVSVTIDDIDIDSDDILFSIDRRDISIESIVGSFVDYFKTCKVTYTTEYDTYRSTIPSNWIYPTFGAWFQPTNDACDIKSISFSIENMNDGTDGLTQYSSKVELLQPGSTIYPGTDVLAGFYGLYAPNTTTTYGGDVVNASDCSIVSKTETIMVLSGEATLDYPIHNVVSVDSEQDGVSIVVGDIKFDVGNTAIVVEKYLEDDDNVVVFATIEYQTQVTSYAFTVPIDWYYETYGAYFTENTPEGTDPNTLFLNIPVSVEAEGGDSESFCSCALIEKIVPENYVYPGDDVTLRYYGYGAPSTATSFDGSVVSVSGAEGNETKVESVVVVDGVASVSYPIDSITSVVMADSGASVSARAFNKYGNEIILSQFQGDSNSYIKLCVITYKTMYRTYIQAVPATWNATNYGAWFQSSDDTCGIKYISYDVSIDSDGDSPLDITDITLIKYLPENVYLGDTVTARYYGKYAPDNATDYNGNVVSNLTPGTQTFTENIVLSMGEASVMYPVSSIVSVSYQDGHEGTMTFSDGSKTVRVVDFESGSDHVVVFAEVTYTSAYTPYQIVVPEDWAYDTYGLWLIPEYNDADVVSLSFSIEDTDDGDDGLTDDENIVVEREDQNADVFLGDVVRVLYYGLYAPNFATGWDGSNDNRASVDYESKQVVEDLLFISGEADASYPAYSITSVEFANSNAPFSEIECVEDTRRLSVKNFVDDAAYLSLSATVTYTARYVAYNIDVPGSWPSTEYGAVFKPALDDLSNKEIEFDVQAADAPVDALCAAISLQSDTTSVVEGDYVEITYYGVGYPESDFTNAGVAIKYATAKDGDYTEQVSLTNGDGETQFPIASITSVVDESDDDVDASFTEGLTSFFIGRYSNIAQTVTITYAAMHGKYNFRTPDPFGRESFDVVFTPTYEGCDAKTISFDYDDVEGEDVWNFCGSRTLEKTSPDDVYAGDTIAFNFYGYGYMDNSLGTGGVDDDVTYVEDAYSVEEKTEDITFTNGVGASSYPVKQITSATFSDGSLQPTILVQQYSKTMLIPEFYDDVEYGKMTATVVYDTDYQEYSVVVPSDWVSEEYPITFAAYMPCEEELSLTVDITTEADDDEEEPADKCGSRVLEKVSPDTVYVGDTVTMRYYGENSQGNGNGTGGTSDTVSASTSGTESITENVTFTNGVGSASYPVYSLTGSTFPSGVPSQTITTVENSKEMTIAAFVDNPAYSKITVSVTYGSRYGDYTVVVPSSWVSESYVVTFTDDTCDDLTLTVDITSGEAPGPEYKDVTLTIYDYHTGVVVEGASVYVDDVLQGTTDEDGQITIEDIETGDHTLKITKDGYVDSDLDAISNETFTVS